MRVVLIVLALALTSCGKPTDALVGAWERNANLPGGRHEHEVLEFSDHGRVLLHANSGALSGSYSGHAKSLALSGPLAQAWPGAIAYRVKGKKLFLDDTVPAGRVDRAAWTRITHAPLFSVTQISGGAVPADLPALLKTVTKEFAHKWRADAVAVALGAGRLPGDDFAMLVSFYSPSGGSGLEARVTRWNVDTQGVARRANAPALPDHFIDLAALLKRANVKGNAFSNALLTTDNKAPVWTVTQLTDGGSATSSYSAVTGKTVQPSGPPHGVVSVSRNGVEVARSEHGVPVFGGVARGFAKPSRDAPSVTPALLGGLASAYAFAPDRGSTESASSTSASSSTESSGANNGYTGEPAPGEPLPNGETCNYSSYAACGAAANGDTWAADRIENGTASGSEKDWYGGPGTADGTENNDSSQNNETPPAEEPQSSEPPQQSEPSYEPPQQSEPEPSYEAPQYSEPEPSYEPAPSYEPPPEPAYEPPPPSENSE